MLTSEKFLTPLAKCLDHFALLPGPCGSPIAAHPASIGGCPFFISFIPGAQCLFCGLTCFCLGTDSCQCFPHLLLAKEVLTTRKREPLLREGSCKSRDKDIQEPEQGGSCGQESQWADGRAVMPLFPLRGLGAGVMWVQS